MAEAVQSSWGVTAVPIFLNGLALRNYRGIGSTMLRLAPFREFNFFIGANNAGKSTILDFM
jgi:predicted ATPase